MAIRRKRSLRWLSRAAITCCIIAGLTSVAFAANDDPAQTADSTLANNGIEEVNEAYDYTIDTETDAVGASAGISSGGWSSLGSKLSYMKFPEGVTTEDGEDGVWCYCIDISTDTQDGHKYSITTLDAAKYYEPEAGDKIRSILLNSYPNISVSDLEQIYQLPSLTEEEAFMATQWILWYYSNPDGEVDAGGGNYYPANIYKPSDYPRSDITIWYDDEEGNEVRAKSSNVVALAKALDQLVPAAAYETEPANITMEKKVYNDKVVFDYRGSKGLNTLKNIEISVKDGNGKEIPFARKGHTITVQRADISMSSDMAEITIELKADQDLVKDVYFFLPEGGRDASQSRVSAYEGRAPVAAVEVFSIASYEFGEDSGYDVTPRTGDNGNMRLLILMMLAALMTTTAMLSTDLSTEKQK